MALSRSICPSSTEPLPPSHQTGSCCGNAGRAGDIAMVEDIPEFHHAPGTAPRRKTIRPHVNGDKDKLTDELTYSLPPFSASVEASGSYRRQHTRTDQPHPPPPGP
ncbi:hypothetical protein DPEC_G00183330 [Dallia pectoralis]|uniref:Uncharacterized protein n=1 Tax=Dallia pectoralis TaxID=75939 RepID=A0ACC2GB37_DALPE|nr:hypothetical protein DPEC_G00183330 [Dallia pectoralis]